MRASAIDAGRQAAGASPIRWAGWAIGLMVSILFWVGIYWAWTAF